MKKVFAVVFCIISFFLNTVAYASGETEVYADALVANDGDTIILPVSIKNNTGIMGFKLTFTYDENCFEVITVDRGELTEKGNFNDNLATKKGQFDVVWNDSEETEKDGTLLFLQVKVIKLEDGKSINISYSEEDTFNEKWQDVIIKCHPIEFLSSDEPVKSTQSTTLTTIDEKSVESKNDSTYIKTAVEAAMKQAQIDKISDLTDGEKDAFIESVNFYLSAFTGTVENGVDSIEVLQEKYDTSLAEKFLQSSLECIDPSRIIDETDAVLSEMNLQSVKNIPDDKKLEFAKKVYEKLNEISEDVTDLPKNPEDAYEAVVSLYKQANQMDKSFRWEILFIVAVSGFLLLSIVVILLIRHNKRKK